MSEWDEFWRAFKVSLAIHLLMAIAAYFVVCFVAGTLVLIPVTGIWFRMCFIAYLFISLFMVPFVHDYLDERDGR